MDERRAARISEAVREELAEIINFELDDPRLRTVNVTAVLLSPDLRHAQVRVGVYGDSAERSAVLKALEHASGYLRHELARRLALRRVPEIQFEADQWQDAPGRIELLLSRARKNRGRE